MTAPDLLAGHWLSQSIDALAFEVRALRRVIEPQAQQPTGEDTVAVPRSVLESWRKAMITIANAVVTQQPDRARECALTVEQALREWTVEVDWTPEPGPPASLVPTMASAVEKLRQWVDGDMSTIPTDQVIRVLAAWHHGPRLEAWLAAELRDVLGVDSGDAKFLLLCVRGALANVAQLESEVRHLKLAAKSRDPEPAG